MWRWKRVVSGLVEVENDGGWLVTARQAGISNACHQVVDWENWVVVKRRGKVYSMNPSTPSLCNVPRLTNLSPPNTFITPTHQPTPFLQCRSSLPW